MQAEASSTQGGGPDAKADAVNGTPGVAPTQGTVPGGILPPQVIEVNNNLSLAAACRKDHCN